MATPEWFSRLKRRTAEIIDFENDALERDMVRSQETEELLEGIGSFFEKRQPDFAKLRL